MIALGVSEGPAPETRSYTTAVVDAFEAAAGAGGNVAAATAAVETASGLWGRALALATVEPRNRRTAALTPSVLAMIGRALCRSGQIVFDLEVMGGRLQMLPASAAYVVVGDARPSTWLYTLTLDGPGATRTVYRTRAAVAHVQYLTDPLRRWTARAPWASASLSGALLAGVERQLSGEAGSASGYILPTPDTGDRGQDTGDDGEDDPLVSLRRDLAAAGGKTVLAPSVSAGYGAGPGAAPQKEYVSTRFGLNPPSGTIEVRRDVERSILAACGVPPVLAHYMAPGGSLREGWRQLHQLTVEPLSELVADQLSEALGQRVTLDMRRARAADIATLSRAIGSLTTAGMTPEQARALVGL